MEVKAVKIDSANATASAKINTQILEAKQDKILKSLSRDAKVDGFRKGKVPASVLKARFGDKVKQDAEQDAIRDLFDNALKKLKLEASQMIGEPHFTKFERQEDGIDVEIKISLRPEINLDGYEKYIPDYKTPEATNEEVNDRLNSILKSAAPLKKIKTKRALKDGDFALVDFEGFVDEKAFEGGKANAYLLEIGSKSFIDGFETGMIGMHAGDNKDINVKFPENYNNKELAGKDAVFKVTLIEIQEKDIPKNVDEDILKRFLPNVENPTVKDLENQIKVQIQNEKLSKIYMEELKPKFVEELVKNLTIDLPDNIVEQEMDVLFRNTFASISKKDMEEFKNNPEKIKEKRESYREDAISSVKLTFIVDELARIHKINVSDQEVTQMIYFEALQYGQDPKQHMENYKQQGVLPAIKMAMIEDKLFGKLFKKDDMPKTKKTTKTSSKDSVAKTEKTTKINKENKGE